MSSSSRENTSICLLEHDLNGDTLVTWSYPGVPPQLQVLCINQFTQHFAEQRASDPAAHLLYFKFKSDWVYMHYSAARKDMCSEIISSALCVVTKTFNPERHQALLAVLHEQFLASGDPTKMLEGHLSVHATGKFKGYEAASFRDEDAMLSVSCVKDIVRYREHTYTHHASPPASQLLACALASLLFYILTAAVLLSCALLCSHLCPSFSFCAPYH